MAVGLNKRGTSGATVARVGGSSASFIAAEALSFDARSPRREEGPQRHHARGEGLAPAARLADSTTGAGAAHSPCREGGGAARGRSRILGCVRGITARGVHQEGTGRRGWAGSHVAAC
jgi:hypothetical protein